MNRITRSTFFLVFLISAELHSQPVSGSGPPEQVLYLRTGALADIRARVQSDALHSVLYRGVYSRALAEGSGQRELARIAKSAAFCALIGSDGEGRILSDSAVSLLRRKANELLSHLQPGVVAGSSDVQWRAVELTQFSEAYAFLAAAGAATPASGEALSAFAAQAHSAAASFLAPKNNLTLKLAAAAGTAALALERAPDSLIRARAAIWREAALQRIEDVLYETQSNNGTTGYAEGPYYFRYAMLQVLPFLDAMDARQNEARPPSPAANPATDPRFLALCDWITALRQPDGRLPAFEDTYMDMGFPELALLGFIGPRDPKYAWVHYRPDGRALDAEGLAAALDGTADFRVEYICAGARPQPAADGSALWASPAAGYTVLRGGGSWLAVIGKHGIARTHGSVLGSGHKQANEGAFILHARGVLLAMEPGYPSYEQRDSVLYGRSHNVLLVDGRGPDNVSLTRALFGSDAQIGDTLSGPGVQSATVRVSYEGARIERTYWMFGDGTVYLRDDARSETEHVFTQQIHGNGLASAGTFRRSSDGTEARWTATPAALHTITESAGGSLSVEAVERRHSPAYRTLASHSAHYMSVRGRAATIFTTLAPEGCGADTAALSRARDGSAAMLTLVRGAVRREAAAGQETGALALGTGPDRIRAVARTLFVERSPGTLLLVFDSARSIEKDGRILFSSVQPLRGLLRIEGDTIELVADAPSRTDVSLGLRREARRVEGGGYAGTRVEGAMFVLADGTGRLNARIEASGPALGISEIRGDAARPRTVYPTRLHAGQPALLTVLAEGGSAALRRVDVYSSLGTVLYQSSFDGAPAEDRGVVHLQLPALPAGLYFLRLDNGGHNEFVRLVVR